MNKEDRQQALLRAIVHEYIKTAKPVSSKTLVTEYGFDYSPATIRNDMAVLEGEGYITQPHTSAGRVPTEKGYQYYITNFIVEKELTKSKREVLEEAVQQQASDERQRMKMLAQTLAELTDETIVISLSGESYYYTGISRMFRKPEFVAQAEMMLHIGEVFDRLDEVMDGMNNLIHQNVQVLVGRDNPFSDNCSMIVSEYHVQDEPGVMGILGPMRMDYDTNIALLEYLEELMDDSHEYR